MATRILAKSAVLTSEISANVAGLTEGVLKTMRLTKLMKLLAVFAILGIVSAGAALFGKPAAVTPVACPGLADAIDAGDGRATAAAVADAAARTPADCAAVVLGCTEYELAADRIAAAVPGAVTFGSAAAVAAQALRRIPAGRNLDANPNGRGKVRMLLSGRPSALPAAALTYPEGRLLAPLVVVDGRESVADLVAGH